MKIKKVKKAAVAALVFLSVLFGSCQSTPPAAVVYEQVYDLVPRSDYRVKLKYQDKSGQRLLKMTLIDPTAVTTPTSLVFNIGASLEPRLEILGEDDLSLVGGPEISDSRYDLRGYYDGGRLHLEVYENHTIVIEVNDVPIPGLIEAQQGTEVDALTSN